MFVHSLRRRPNIKTTLGVYWERPCVGVSRVYWDRGVPLTVQFNMPNVFYHCMSNTKSPATNHQQLYYFKLNL